MSSTTNSCPDGGHNFKRLSQPFMLTVLLASLWLIAGLALYALGFSKFSQLLDALQVCELSAGIVLMAAKACVLYGWALPLSGICVLAMLSGKSAVPCKPLLYSVVYLVYNFCVVLGVLGIISAKGSGLNALVLPDYTWVAVWLCLLLMFAPAVANLLKSGAKLLLASDKLLLAALIGVVWIVGVAHFSVLLGVQNSWTTSAIDGWFNSSFLYMCQLGLCLAVAMYFTSKFAQLPINGTYANLCLFSLLLFAPWAGMEACSGSPLPRFMSAAGNAVNFAMILPVVACWLALRSAAAKSAVQFSSNAPLRFALSAVYIALIAVLANALCSLPATYATLQFSVVRFGNESLLVFGSFAFAASAVVYAFLPRLLGRSWLYEGMQRFHFWFSLIGLALLGMFTVIGGISHAQAINAWDQSWSAAVRSLAAYSVGTSIGLLCLLIANVAFVLHCALLCVGLGRRINTKPANECQQADVQNA